MVPGPTKEFGNFCLKKRKAGKKDHNLSMNVSQIERIKAYYLYNEIIFFIYYTEHFKDFNNAGVLRDF
jgi:hypothetical protein